MLDEPGSLSNQSTDSREEVRDGLRGYLYSVGDPDPGTVDSPQVSGSGNDRLGFVTLITRHGSFGTPRRTPMVHDRHPLIGRPFLCELFPVESENIAGGYSAGHRCPFAVLLILAAILAINGCGKGVDNSSVELHHNCYLLVSGLSAAEPVAKGRSRYAGPS